jgi:hypothetical protein
MAGQQLSCSPWLMLLLLQMLIASVVSQMTACADGSTGYATTLAINNDINAEERIIAAGGPAATSYLYRLCPNTVLEVLGPNDILIPRLAGSVFRCGDNGAVADRCSISGGTTTQVEIVPSVIPGYVLSDVAFEGITFTRFAGSAISGTATGVTKVTLTNSEFTVSKCDATYCYFYFQSSV